MENYKLHHSCFIKEDVEPKGIDLVPSGQPPRLFFFLKQKIKERLIYTKRIKKIPSVGAFYRLCLAHISAVVCWRLGNSPSLDWQRGVA